MAELKKYRVEITRIVKESFVCFVDGWNEDHATERAEYEADSSDPEQWKCTEVLEDPASVEVEPL